MTYLRSGKSKKLLVISQLKFYLKKRCGMSITTTKKLFNLIITYKDILFDDELLKNALRDKIREFYENGYIEFNRYHYLLFDEYID